jgi:hypothetical protein
MSLWSNVPTRSKVRLESLFGSDGIVANRIAPPPVGGME